MGIMTMLLAHHGEIEMGALSVPELKWIGLIWNHLARTGPGFTRHWAIVLSMTCRSMFLEYSFLLYKKPFACRWAWTPTPSLALIVVDFTRTRSLQCINDENAFSALQRSNKGCRTS